MNRIYIGWAEESIVPDKKVSLEGQFFERISEYVESEISATAMAVETEDDEMILVSVDMVYYDEKCEKENSGTYKAYKYAQKKRKKIINVFSEVCKK